MLFEGMSKGLMEAREVPMPLIDRVRRVIERYERSVRVEAHVGRWGLYQSRLLNDVVATWWGGERILGDASAHSMSCESALFVGSLSPRDTYESRVEPLVSAAIDNLGGTPTASLPALDPVHAQMVTCAVYAELERQCVNIALCPPNGESHALVEEAVTLAAVIGYLCGMTPDVTFLEDWGLRQASSGTACPIEVDERLLVGVRSLLTLNTFFLRQVLEDAPWPGNSGETVARNAVQAERELLRWREAKGWHRTLIDWAKPIPAFRGGWCVTPEEVVSVARAIPVSRTAPSERAVTLSMTRGAAQGLAAICDVLRVRAARGLKDVNDPIYLTSGGHPTSLGELADFRMRLADIGGDPWEALS